MVEDNEKTGIIYSYYCKTTGQRYIGKTVNPKDRHRQHMRDVEKKNDTHNKFHNALRKYPYKDFWEYEILESDLSKKQLSAREVYWIAYYNSFNKGYNMTPGGDGVRYCKPWNYGKKWSKDIINKISQTRKGQVSGFKGHKHSKESLKIMSDKLKGNVPPNKGIPMSEEQKKKISETKKGRKMSEETKRKISESIRLRNKIKNHTNEHERIYKGCA